MDKEKTPKINEKRKQYRKEYKKQVYKKCRKFCLDYKEKHLDFSVQRVGQDVRYALNDNKLRSLGWSPQCQFDEELKEIFNFYKENFIW